ncbi:MAG: carboxyl-terminal processing protease [Desulforhopalus sp.]|jgi:carboxyl-terminal processing protease
MTIMKNKKIFSLLGLVAFLLLSFSLSTAAVNPSQDIDRKRNRLIGYILSKQLPPLHFSDKELDDELSKATFHLYIKQLDFQKRFLLKEDVNQLEAFAPYIDNNLSGGHISLPDTGFDILNEKINIVQDIAAEMLVDENVKIGTSAGEDTVVGSFNVSEKDTYETDPDKIDFVENIDGLRDRWRKILKMQLISQYFDLKEEQDKKLEKSADPVATKKEIKDDAALWQESLLKIRKRNNNFFLRLHQETLQDHYDRYFNCITRAFGPHTNYIPPASKEQFDINMRGSLEGIGALLREDDGLIKVVRIIPGSASAIQGSLKAEDVIYEVAQEGEEPVDITDMRLRDAVRLIRGPKGEAVTLTVKKSDGSKETIKIIRDVVQIEETFVKSTVVESKDGRKTGYIFIPSFYRDFEGSRNGGNGRNSTDDTRVELDKLKDLGVEGLILDLRDDGGGALVDAVDITGLFIESGPVVQVKNSFGDSRILRDNNDGVEFDGPLVVLVNQFSASASEIVAAALQDYKRAVIVGSKHTHGKGTVQTIIDLNENIPLLQLKKYDDLGALKVMIQKFYRVTGGSTQYKGVEPDIVLPNLYEHIKSGERYLDYSLPWDSIDPIDYTPAKGHSLDLEQLKERSLARAAADEGFQVIKEEAEKALARSKDTILTIQFDDMLQKRLEAEQVREKVGAHYQRFQDAEEEEKDLENGITDKKDMKKKWLEEVNNDPYIREAVNIIADIIKL